MEVNELSEEKGRKVKVRDVNGLADKNYQSGSGQSHPTVQTLPCISGLSSITIG
jgi:hypothetical protein